MKRVPTCDRTLQAIKAEGMKAGVALIRNTNIALLEDTRSPMLLMSFV